jgi:hypothetical protein
MLAISFPIQASDEENGENEGEKQYRMYPFTDFYSSNALKDFKTSGAKGDLSPLMFSLTKLRKILSSDFDFNKGYLRLKVNPLEQGRPDYFQLNGVDDDYGDDDEKFQEIIKQFLFESQNFAADSFILEFVKKEESRKRQRRE